ncbi:MAG: hypothetical protein Q9200_001098 [Gallowayella weberi]
MQTETPCPLGLNAEGLCKSGSFLLAWQKRSDAPNLCVNCYRRHVDDVIARYKQEIKTVDDMINSITWRLRAASTESTRQELKAERSKWEVDRGDLIDARYAELDAFRISQGVWGDAPFGTMDKAEAL